MNDDLMETASIDCPSCGHSFVHRSGVREPQSERSDSLSDLQDRVRNLDAVISRLNQERASALRDINNLRDKTSRLPPEILSRIFQLVRPPIDFHNHLPATEGHDRRIRCRHFRRDTYHREEDYHFSLAAVSRRWRQIVLSTPQLWTTLSIGVWDAFNGSHISLLDLYSRCAGDLGISMELDFRYHLLRRPEEGRQEEVASLALLKPVLEAFIGFAPKIQHLSLISPPSEIIFSINKDFSSCSSLIIQDIDLFFWWGARPPVVVDLPHLQRVSLHSFNSSFILPWLSITSLELNRMPRSVSFDGLMRCVNLVKFSTRVTPPSSYTFPRHPEPTVHENLELMLFDDVDLYHRFRFTKLRALHWNNIYMKLTNCHIRRVIFANLPSTLVSLTLGQVRLAGDMEHGLQDLFICVPQLAELRLFECDHDFICFVIKSISRRAQPSQPQVSPVLGSTILPNLRKLFIPSAMAIFSGIIVDMLEAMSTVRTNEEGFYIEVYNIHWDEEASQRLQELASQGFNFDIRTEIEIPKSMDLPWW